jgi:hypothetical protein
MADNQNNNPGLAGSTEDAKRAIEFSKEARKVQGDHRDILKESEDLLKKMSRSYDKIEGRLESLSKESINIKQINQEILKAREKDFIVSKKLAESAKQVNADNNDNVKSYLDSLRFIATAREEDKAQLEEIAQSQFDMLNIEEQRYANLVEADKLNKHSVEYSEAKLKVEKEVNSNIGITGRLMGIIGKKLGANNDVYADMVENAKELNAVGAKLTFGDKLRFLGKSIKSGIKETISDPAALFASIGAVVPIIGGAISGLVGGLKSAFDYITGIQDKTVKFARVMNISTEQARKIKMEYADFSISSGDIFVNSQKMVDVQMKLVDQLGITNLLTNEQLATNIKLLEIADLQEDVQKGVTEASIINRKSASSVVKSVLAQVQGLKQATGIQFQHQQILKEAANLGGVLGLQFAKYPDKLTKSLVTVKAMGLELKELDSMADSFLDFESSISKEFEAQLLTGKEINLAKARELFLDNDLAGAAAEINKQVGSTADFMKMNRIQQDAFAGAMGMSRDQMGDMLKKQEMLSKLGAKDTDNAREQLRLGLQKYKNQKALTEAIGEEAYQNLTNASLQEKIAAFIEKIQQSISDFVEKSGIIDKIENFMEYLSKPENIRRAIIAIRDVFAQIVDIVASIAGGIVSVLDFFGAISDQKAASIQGFLGGAGDNIRSMGGDLSSLAAKDRIGGNTSGGTASTASSTKMGRPYGGDSTTIIMIDGQPVATAVRKAEGKNSHLDENTTGKH